MAVLGKATRLKRDLHETFLRAVYITRLEWPVDLYSNRFHGLRAGETGKVRRATPRLRGGRLAATMRDVGAALSRPVDWRASQVEHQELPLRVPAPEREDRRARIGAPNVTHFSTRLVRVRLGVLNLTPDSFSDGGRFLTAEAALSHGRCDIIDVVASRPVRGQCRYRKLKKSRGSDRCYVSSPTRSTSRSRSIPTPHTADKHNSKQYGRNAAR